VVWLRMNRSRLLQRCSGGLVRQGAVCCDCRQLPMCSACAQHINSSSSTHAEFGWTKNTAVLVSGCLLRTYGACLDHKAVLLFMKAADIIASNITCNALVRCAHSDMC
jgi:hypothetical protein